ncbi:UNVERIFIED_CONTAM: hypothetical protein HDU68_003506 [Siphonaria sp. JEL0065]|nr:hypothetical protein HDU68_003506 [Siphonaria sp. JEL0065]
MFRLTVCAISAHYACLPAHIALSYYQRARKAFIRSEVSKPTHQTVQALVNICLFAQAKDQPALKLPFLQRAIDLIIALRLDVDPDDSPWLYNLNLTPRQKEDRRRAFWNCYMVLVEEHSTSSDTIAGQLDATKIKPLSTIHDPHLVFESYQTAAPILNVEQTIANIRLFYSKVPTNGVRSIFASQETMNLDASLFTVHSSIPLNLLLIPSSLDEFISLDHVRFTDQLESLPALESSATILLNLIMQSSICLLYRPKLYVSALKNYKPSRLTHSEQYILHNAITQSHESALKLLHLFSFFVGLPEQDSEVINNLDNEQQQERQPLPRHCYFHKITHNTCFYSLFEAFCVLWFIFCRMHPEWRQFSIQHTQLLVESQYRLKRRMTRMLEFMKDAVEYTGPKKEGVFVPLIVCMDAMLKEMGCNDVKLEDDETVVVDQVILGMKVISLGTGAGSSVADSFPEPSVIREPRAFLGLLGMEVGGGIKWPGPREENWRLFWKLYS